MQAQGRRRDASAGQEEVCEDLVRWISGEGFCCCSCKEPDFGSQPPCHVAHVPVTLAPGHLMLSAGLLMYPHICGNTYTYIDT